MKRIATLLLASAIFAAAAGTASAAGTACFRGDAIGHVKMTDGDKAVATDKQGKRFDITFAGLCGARHLNVYFVLKPESLPLCIAPGTAFPTNREGVCIVKSVTLQQ
jgi:hypothetical protein